MCPTISHQAGCKLRGCVLQQQALMLNAAAEIGTGFMSVVSLLSPPRSLLLPFMVWQILKMRYWSPDAATYHRQVRHMREIGSSRMMTQSKDDIASVNNAGC